MAIPAISWLSANCAMTTAQQVKIFARGSRMFVTKSLNQKIRFLLLGK